LTVFFLFFFYFLTKKGFRCGKNLLKGNYQESRLQSRVADALWLSGASVRY